MELLLKGFLKTLDTANDLLNGDKAPYEVATFNGEQPDENQIIKLEGVARDCHEKYDDKFKICLVKEMCRNKMNGLYILLGHKDLYRGTGNLGMDLNLETLNELFSINREIYNHVGGNKLWEEADLSKK